MCKILLVAAGIFCIHLWRKDVVPWVPEVFFFVSFEALRGGSKFLADQKPAWAIVVTAKDSWGFIYYSAKAGAESYWFGSVFVSLRFFLFFFFLVDAENRHFWERWLVLGLYANHVRTSHEVRILLKRIN